MTTATDRAVNVRDKIYIGGQWVQSSGTGVLEVINSTTEQVMGSVPEGTVEDVDNAVAAARSAFESWSQTSVQERADWMQRISEGLGARMDEIAELIAQEVGMPIKLSNIIQAGLPTTTFGSMPKLLAELQWEEEVGNSLIVREPVGVVGTIAPWNCPLRIAGKVAPALAAGCTVVIKPSEDAPLTAIHARDVIDEAGLPEGVFNIVPAGLGDRRALARTRTGHDLLHRSHRGRPPVARLAAANVKRVTLELGGKTPNIILDDADLEKAIPMACRAVRQLRADLRRRDADARRAIRWTRPRASAPPPGRSGRRSVRREATMLGPLVTGQQRARAGLHPNRPRRGRSS